MIRPPTSKWYTHIREIATGVADFFFLVWWIIIRPLVIWITSKLLLDMRFLLLLTAIIFAWASASCQTTQRIKLTQLERSAIVEGSRSGQIGLTNANGDQRYAQYVEVNLTPIAYVPATSGNANNLSEFVVDPNTDVWFIDWQGNAIQLKVCDNDWLVIGNNECPDAVTDSIYHYKYAAIGARYVWPNAELLVNDSVGVGITGISGSRNARLFLYDQNSTGSFTVDHGGTSTLMYIEQGGELRVATSSGTAETPLLQTNHFAVNAADSTIQMHRYPDTRNDTGNPVNVLSSDATGKVRSHPVAEVVSAAGGVTGSGASPRVAYFSGASSVTGEAAFIYTAASNTLTLGETGQVATLAFADTSTTTPLITVKGQRFLHTLDNRSSSIINGHLFLGYESGASTIAGQNNIAIGNQALSRATGAVNDNVAIGVRALYGNNYTGGANTAIGYQSMTGRTAGNSNTALGFNTNSGAVTSSDVTSIGASANSSSTGSQLTAVGANCLINSTSSNNVAIGYAAMASDLGAITGGNNTAIGTLSMRRGTGISDNTAVGYRTLDSLTTGDNNTVIGSDGLRDVTTGSNNTAIGYQVALNSSTPGMSGTVLIGYQAGLTNTASNVLFVDNSGTTTPLIGGDFANNRVGINTDPSSISSSAVLEVTSTTGGILFPRMTTAQRNAIATPADGLIIFCTDCTATDGSTGVSQTYSSSAWRNHY